MANKAKYFKKWCAERQGHPPQIKAALEAVLELEAELDKCHNVLNGVYQSGLKLDEHENSVREALGLPDL